MNLDEFAKWGIHHQAIFPDFANWWQNLKQSNPASSRTITDQWFSILARTRLQDAIEASNRMLAGLIDLCPAYERSMLASRIAAAARDVAAERLPTSHTYVPRYRASQPGEGPTAGELYMAALKTIDAKKDPLPVLREMMPKRDDTNGRRYRCHKCLDSGLVSVWSKKCLAYAFRGEIPPSNKRGTMLVACDCQEGDQLCLGDDERAPKQWHGWRESARYAPDRYCRVDTDAIDDPQRIDELMEWARDYKAPNRVAAFDQWNATKE